MQTRYLGKPSDIESLRIQLSDIQAHTLKAGSGPPVVLVHGGASDSRDWLETINRLAGDYSLYAVDMVGFGLSDRPKEDYCLSDFVSFTTEFLRELRFNSQVLVGHSLGGRVCLEIALNHPELVRQLVLVDTVGFGKLAWWGMGLGAIVYGVREFLGRPQPYPRFVKEEGEDKNWICLTRLSELKVPTLIVWNKWDPYYPVSGALKANRLIPDSRLEVFPGFGHAPHMQRGEKFATLLSGFLNGHTEPLVSYRGTVQ